MPNTNPIKILDINQELERTLLIARATQDIDASHRYVTFSGTRSPDIDAMVTRGLTSLVLMGELDQAKSLCLRNPTQASLAHTSVEPTTPTIMTSYTAHQTHLLNILNLAMEKDFNARNEHELELLLARSFLLPPNDTSRSLDIHYMLKTSFLTFFYTKSSNEQLGVYDGALKFVDHCAEKKRVTESTAKLVKDEINYVFISFAEDLCRTTPDEQTGRLDNKVWFNQNVLERMCDLATHSTGSLAKEAAKGLDKLCCGIAETRSERKALRNYIETKLPDLTDPKVTKVLHQFRSPVKKFTSLIQGHHK